MDMHEIELVDIGSLKPDPSNARTHPKKQIEQLVNSMKTFGITIPLLIDKNDQVIAGHGRLLALKSMKKAQVPVIRASHLSPEEARAYALADNKIALGAGWDDGLLRVSLEQLMEAKLDFAVDVTGFSTPEIDLIVHGSDALDVPAKAPPAIEETVSRLGDVWVLGRHVIVCGDCRTSSDLTRVLNGEQIALGITDPPFNVKIGGHVSGLGEVQHREFAMAAGEMSSLDFEGFLRDSVGQMARLARPGALLYIYMDWRHLPELQAATNALGLQPVNLCVWVKSNGGMGSFYRSRHELVWIVKIPGAGHINNVELGKHGRYRTNVWNYAGMNAFGAERDATLSLHPTVKPVAMIRDAMLDASNPKDWVLDMFLGSGTTLLAAEQCGRRCLGVELDPGYVDVAISRWRELTGNEPRHLDSDKSWTQVAVERGIRPAA